MYYIKKILATIVLFSLIGTTSLSSTYAEEIELTAEEEQIADSVLSYFLTDIDSDFTSLDLLEIKNWAKYKSQIDSFYDWIWNDENAIRNISIHLEPIINSTWEDEVEKLAILNYIAAKNNLVILENNYNIVFTDINTSTTDQALIVPVAPESRDSVVVEVQSVTPELKALSNSEALEVEEAVLSFQAMMLDSTFAEVEWFIKRIEKQSQFTETGNANIKWSINIDSIWNLSSEIDIKNYEFKNDYLNSQFRWVVEALITSDNKEIDTDISVSSFVDLIQKNGSIYLLLEDLEIEQSSVVQNFFLEVLKAIWQEEKHIRFWENLPDKILNLYSSFDPQVMIQELNTMKTTPMMTPYWKDWDKVILMPSKEACDMIKELMSVFDPFNGHECSDNQYIDMIKDYLKEDIEMYMILWDTTVMGIQSIIGDTNLYIKTTYTDSSLLSFTLSLIENEGENLINIEYIASDFFRFEAKIPSANISINTNTTNNDISWSFDAEVREYDYFSQDYTPSNRVEGTIEWTTNIDNTLNTLAIRAIWNDLLEGTQPMSFNFEYSKNTLALNYDYVTTNTTTNFDLSCNIDNNWNIIGGNLNIEANGKKSEFDYDTYEIVYVWEKEKIFETNMTLTDTIINWDTAIYNYGEAVMTMNHSWSFTPGLFSLKNKFEFVQSPFPISVENETDALNGNINFDYSYTNFTNNFNFLFEVFLWAKSLLDIEIQNDSSTKYGKPSIEVPDEYIDLDDLY